MSHTQNICHLEWEMVRTMLQLIIIPFFSEIKFDLPIPANHRWCPLLVPSLMFSPYFLWKLGPRQPWEQRTRNHWESKHLVPLGSRDPLYF